MKNRNFRLANGGLEHLGPPRAPRSTWVDGRGDFKVTNERSVAIKDRLLGFGTRTESAPSSNRVSEPCKALPAVVNQCG